METPSPAGTLVDLGDHMTRGLEPPRRPVTDPIHSVWIARRALPHGHRGTCKFARRSLRPVREAGCKGPKCNDDDSSPTGCYSGEQRLVAVVCGNRADSPESSGPAAPVGPKQPRRLS